MQLKEYPEVTKEGETVIPKTSSHDLIRDFSEQMFNRGNVNMVFFNDPSIDPEDGEYPSGAAWSPDFTPTDMVNLVVTYANMSLDPRQKLLFSTQIQNAILTEAMNDEYDYEIDEEYPEDEE